MQAISKHRVKYSVWVAGFRTKEHLREVANHIKEWVRRNGFVIGDVPMDGTAHELPSGEVVIIEDETQVSGIQLVGGHVVDLPEACKRRRNKALLFMIAIKEVDSHE